jgi:hypothetical protein
MQRHLYEDERKIVSAILNLPVNYSWGNIIFRELSFTVPPVIGS